MAGDAPLPLDPVAGEVEAPAADAEEPAADTEPPAAEAEEPRLFQQALVTRQLLRPDGTVLSGWLTGGTGSAWEKLDEPVTQPAAVDSVNDHLWAGGADQVTEVSLQNPSMYRGDAGEVTAWFYGNTGASTQVRVELVSGGQVRASALMPAMSGFAWRSFRFTVGQRLELDDLRLRFRSLGGPDANIRAAYVEVGPASYAVLGSAVKVRPHEFPMGPIRASIFAARNEFESFQVVVMAPNAPVRSLRAAFSVPLTGPNGAVIPSRNVTVYREGYYNVRTPSDLEGAVGRWPDPLIPAVDPLLGQTRNAFPVDVPMGENRTLWVDVQVPHNAPVGVYQGNLKLTANDMSVDIPVQLKVLNFTLPSTTTLKSSYGLTPGMECQLGTPNCETDLAARAKARQLFVRSALDNRITTARAHATNLRTGSTTGVQEFRTYTLPFIKGTAPTRLPGARLTTYQVGHHKAAYDMGTWREEARVGGFENLVFLYGCDEPHFFPVYGDDYNNWQICKRQLAEAEKAWPSAPRMVTAHIQSAEHNGGTAQVDIMVINVELLHGPAGGPWFAGDQRPLYDSFLQNTNGRPKELWLYAACGSHGCVDNDDPYTNGWAGFEIDAPASESRAMAWLAFRYRLTGTLYYDMGMLLPKAWDDQYYATGNGDGNMMYAGTTDRIGGTDPIPIESLRMKLVRDGYEDYEYLEQLRRLGYGSEAQEIARSLFPAPYDTAKGDAQVQAARTRLAQRLAQLLGGPTP
jgi:hypothetical protein